MRRAHPTWRVIAATLLALLLTLPAGSTALAQDKTYDYERINVSIEVQPDGTLDVSETLALRYQGGPFTRASRSISLQRLDDVRDISLSEGERAYMLTEAGSRPGSFIVQRESDKVAVNWHYEPTSDTVRTFTLRYRVDGAVRVDGATHEVWWIAVFADRSVPVRHSQVSLRLPEGVQLRREDIALPAADGILSVEENLLRVVRDQPLPGGQSLDVRVRFPAGLVQASIPRWQVALSTPAPASNGINFLWLPVVLIAVITIGIWLDKRSKRRSRASNRASKSTRTVSSSSKSSSKRNASQSRASNRSSKSAYSAGSWDSSSSSSSSSSSWSSSSSSSWDSSSSSWDSGSSSSSDSGGSGGGSGDAG